MSQTPHDKHGYEVHKHCEHPEQDDYNHLPLLNVGTVELSGPSENDFLALLVVGQVRLYIPPRQLLRLLYFLLLVWSEIRPATEGVPPRTLNFSFDV